MEKKCTHGSHRNELRWYPRRCSVVRSNPASPASESGSSRVSPAAQSSGCPWIRGPAGILTRSPALLLTPGGGRRAETPGTPRFKPEHPPPSRWSRLRGGERSRWRLEGRGRRDGGMQAQRRGWSHLRTGVLQYNPSLLLPFTLFLSSSLTHTPCSFFASLFFFLFPLPVHQHLSFSFEFYHLL